MNKIKIDPVANRWVLIDDEWFSVTIVIESRKQRDKSIKFVVTSGSEFFLHNEYLDFCMGDRDNDEFMNKTRFDSFEKALEIYEKFVTNSLAKKAATHSAMAIQRKYNDGVIIENPKMTQIIKELKNQD